MRKCSYMVAESQQEHGIKELWITVNRRCNFRCAWCYAEATWEEKNDMSSETLRWCLNLSRELGIKKPIILGGEPTLYENLPDIIREANKFGLTPAVITNGYKLGNESYFRRFDDLNVEFGLSLKTWDSTSMKTFAGNSNIEQVKRAINNLSKSNHRFGVSMVITKITIDHIYEMIRLSENAGAKSIGLILGGITFDSLGEPSQGVAISFEELPEQLLKLYDKIKDVKTPFVFGLTAPFCIFPKGFIRELKEKERIKTGCQALSRNGVIFNEKGNLLLCSALHFHETGIYGVDYFDKASFINHWNKKELIEVNEQLTTYPSEECEHCKMYEECCGGCPTQWFINNPNKLRRFI